MNDMEKDFRNIVEDALKKLEEGGTELSSGIVFLYGEKDDKFLRVMRSTSEDKSRFVQNAVELAKKAGFDYEGIEGELGHLFFCQCLCADMEEIALKSLEEKIGSRKSPKKESKNTRAAQAARTARARYASSAPIISVPRPSRQWSLAMQ